MNPQNLTIGIDLGDRRHHVCVLDAAGEIVAEEVIVNTREVLTAFSMRYPGASLVLDQQGNPFPKHPGVFPATRGPLTTPHRVRMEAWPNRENRASDQTCKMANHLLYLSQHAFLGKAPEL